MMKVEKIKAIIIDDSSQARKLLRLMLHELAPHIFLMAEAENATDGFNVIKQLQPDLIFLDIEMPGKSGIQLAEDLLNNHVKCDIIFTTAYNDFALKAFRLSAIDYLLKPLQEKQLLEALAKVEERKDLERENIRLQVLLKNMNEQAEQSIAIPVQNGYEYIKVKDIEYLMADGSYVHLYLSGKRQKTISKNLKYFEQALEQFTNFIRVHRSYLINMDYMTSFSRSERGTITMKSGKLIDLARDRREAFFKNLESK